MTIPMRRMFIVIGILMCWVSVVAAQNDCPAIVQKALDVADTACKATGRNQACYGNITLNGIPQAGVTNFTFSKAGDVVNVADLQSLTLSSLDMTTEQWGVALLKLQANLPDTLPGQNVTMLLFGDVHIQNAVTSIPIEPSPSPAPTLTAIPVLLPLKIEDTVTVWSVPLPSAEVVVRLPAGQTMQADGKDERGAWLHLQPFDGNAGWVLVDTVTIQGEIGLLPVLNADGTFAPQPQTAIETPQSAPSVGPMQAFYFKSGAKDRPCAEAPDSGILVQSPQGAAEINLTVNGVDVTLGSTAYFQAQPGGDMLIYVVEGHGTVSAFGKTVTVPAGTSVRIPIDANLNASGVPSDPEPYPSNDLVALPLQNLPDVISSASPLSTDDILALNTPQAGNWLLTYDTQYIDVGCAADAYNGGFTTEIRYDSTGAMLWYSITLFPSGYGVYKSVANPGATTPHLYTMVVTSPTTIEGQNVWIVPGCAIITNNFHLVRQ